MIKICILAHYKSTFFYREISNEDGAKYHPSLNPRFVLGKKIKHNRTAFIRHDVRKRTNILLLPESSRQLISTVAYVTNSLFL